MEQAAIIGLAPDQPKYRILVVDDKWTNRQLLIRLLAPLGFELREAEDGQEAISISQSFKPHLIWMDIRMPVMDGIEATNLKSTPEGKSIVIIALTASSYDEEHSQAIRIVCDDMLRKPFQIAEVFEMMSRYLGVRYVYDDNGQGEAAEEQSPLLVSEAGALAQSLPPELIQSLVEAIELGDVQTMNKSLQKSICMMLRWPRRCHGLHSDMNLTNCWRY